MPLQLALQQHPEWRARPVVVVDEDKPQGQILWANEHALAQRVRPGLRYAAGLSLCSELCADVVADDLVAAAVVGLTERLRAFTPEIEPSGDEPGVFWLNARGVFRLFPSLGVWARGLVDDLRHGGFRARVAVGFDRFATYALARGAGRGRGALVQVLDSPHAERERADAVPLVRLHFDAAIREALDQLGIVDVGGLRRLPDGGLLERFGAVGHRLQRLAAGRSVDPLDPAAPEPDRTERFDREPDDAALDRTALLFLVKQRLSRLRASLAQRGEAFAALRLTLSWERRAPDVERIVPAAPTLDEVQLVDLVRLRLETVTDARDGGTSTQADTEAAWRDEIVGFELTAEAARAPREQLELFAADPRRDPRAGDRALARLRAAHGETAVACAEIRAGHLPEAQVAWRPWRSLREARPRSANGGGGGVAVPPRLVRRLLTQPILTSRQRHEPDGWFAGGLGRGPVQRLVGPYRVSGGWWRRRRRRQQPRQQHEGEGRGEVERDYYFAETRRGDVLWLFFDRVRRCWFAHGCVE